ncbi:MAG TPA: cyclic dehypoxanthinyl futalosine synthase [Chitinophagales bacterium]|nr:dehypoxanthine futalosine cyclase [Chitinophagales bacterium]HNE46246.1 cyclic dehypoxanthinyl futalosine synthase [Chitinophagales bacterium]HNJ90058.1 cyclic dehypoxanthinyl futalosine synthase [Chitinophagales bacterium]HNK96930.1 cyclic dehypoxanthinyl futalosine synthase [Chitinophagales bacterium]HNM08388.1 cyclic dehypoxanthinyl futalosine synthase [Chitinophagales bacterium]
MQLDTLYSKALAEKWLTVEEGIYLFEHAPTAALMQIADTLRKRKKPGNKVTWIIDRNLNTTNICVANCKFCNFYRVPGHAEGYITDMETYKVKIEETIRYGGEQLLLQGGHHPELGLDFYTDIFRGIKEMFPNVKLHALGPPEIHHIATLGGYSYTYVLSELMKAGLDSLPGAGAEILIDRVRKIISTGKCLSDEWLDVMRAAHQLGLTTSATMMFGHIETIEERFLHLEKIRQVQSEKPEHAKGFIAFIPWPFQDEGTTLRKIRRAKNETTPDEYIRTIAMSRIFLPNIENIQASWLTVGKKTAQICLHAGANDFGSIMIEENVVSAAGAPHRFTYKSIQEAIREAGFEPQLRTQQYEDREIPANIQEQVINY